MTPPRAGSCGTAMPSMAICFGVGSPAWALARSSRPSSPWQNPYVERLIGSIRRECLDHVIVFNETHLRRTLGDYIAYYHQARTHLSLAKDAPTPRRAQAVTDGDVIAFPEVGGLHHRYERHAA